MSAIPRPIAREIDALSRAAHRFHRFAHHPLCDEYAGEVVRLGRRGRVCRGCLFVAMGAVTGGLGSLALPIATPVAAILVMASAAFLLVTTVLRIGPRVSKTFTRFLPAAAMGAALSTGFRTPSWPEGVGLSLLTALTFGALVVLYRRRGGDRTPCSRCPERTSPTPCRGLAPIVRRERAFQRLAGRALTRAGMC